MMLHARLPASLTIALLIFPAPVAAQTFPNRNITLIATFPAGGPTDGIARVVAHELSERLGQRVVVENRGGAGGTIGAANVAKAPPDGHTLLITSSGPLGYYRVLYKTLPYDPVKDFAPISLIGTIPQMMVVSPKLPVNDLTEFVAYAKNNPGKVNIGDSGVGTTLHILAAQFAMLTKTSIQHVHYRGAAGSVSDTIGGQIEAALTGFTPAFASTKVLGVTWSERLKVLPQVPTFREHGIDIVSGLSLTLVAPLRTPPEIIDRINAVMNEFLRSDRGKSFESNYSLIIAGGPPARAREFLANETERLEPVIRTAKISAE
jgi:tripartite-type tricarboxylate transporter receptor subunit TctC